MASGTYRGVGMGMVLNPTRVGLRVWSMVCAHAHAPYGRPPYLFLSNYGEPNYAISCKLDSFRLKKISTIVNEWENSLTSHSS